MLKRLKRWKYSLDPFYLRNRSLLHWCYAAYLTLRYVDEWQVFPAIQFRGKVKVRFVKHKTAKIIIRNRVFMEQWMNGEGSSVFTLMPGAVMDIAGDFSFGGGTRCFIDRDATLLAKGRLNESDSGITANSVLMVNKHLEIGHDCIIAWDTYLTDCDWHDTGKGTPVLPTRIGNHVWIGVGVKVLKGVSIGEHSIVGTNSVVVAGDYEGSAFISGIPAKVVKQNIPLWNRNMQPPNHSNGNN